MSPPLLTVGQVARRSGVAVSALHFYEARGLIHALRTDGNQRRFARDVLRRIAFIRAGQAVGIPLAEIGEVLATLPDARTPDRNDWRRLGAVWRDRLDARIRYLAALRDALDDCIGCGCLSMERCRLHNPGDILAEAGPGPHRAMPVADALPHG